MSSLLWFLILSSIAMTVILAIMLLHLPTYLKRLVAPVPPWAMTLLVHFGYGAFLGGVTGHLLAAFLSIPFGLAYAFYLRPRMQAEIEASNETIRSRLSDWIPFVRSSASQSETAPAV